MSQHETGVAALGTRPSFRSSEGRTCATGSGGPLTWAGRRRLTKIRSAGEGIIKNRVAGARTICPLNACLLSVSPCHLTAMQQRTGKEASAHLWNSGFATRYLILCLGVRAASNRERCRAGRSPSLPSPSSCSRRFALKLASAPILADVVMFLIFCQPLNALSAPGFGRRGAVALPFSHCWRAPISDGLSITFARKMGKVGDFGRKPVVSGRNRSAASKSCAFEKNGYCRISFKGEVARCLATYVDLATDTEEDD